MELAPCISQIATLLADPKRSAMVWALIDGTARGSEELASLAGVSTSSACAHLARLSAGGLLRHESRGRKRFFRLAAPEVGAAVEALASVSVARSDNVGPSPMLAAPMSMRRARICGEHLGGELAADLFQRLVVHGWVEQIDQRVEVTSKGSALFAGFGIFTQALAHHQHPIACACCDWSGRRPHLGGALGASLMKLFMQSGWLRLNEDSRTLQVSSTGLFHITRIGQQAQAGPAVQAVP